MILSRYRVAPMVIPKITELAFNRVRDRYGPDCFFKLPFADIIEQTQADIRQWYADPAIWHSLA